MRKSKAQERLEYEKFVIAFEMPPNEVRRAHDRFEFHDRTVNLEELKEWKRKRGR